jgi:hypothetical protein
MELPDALVNAGQVVKIKECIIMLNDTAWKDRISAKVPWSAVVVRVELNFRQIPIPIWINEFRFAVIWRVVRSVLPLVLAGIHYKMQVIKNRKHHTDSFRTGLSAGSRLRQALVLPPPQPASHFLYRSPS